MRLRYLGLAALAALTSFSAQPETIHATPPGVSKKAQLGAPQVAMLVGDPLGTSSALRLAAMDDIAASGDARLGPPLTVLQHAEGAAVTAVIDNHGSRSRIFAIADEVPDPHQKDLSFAGTLFELSPKGSRVLADRVVHASRAVITTEGKVLVARGDAGSASSPSTMREDHLQVDEIDPDARTSRTIVSSTGYLLFVIGSVGSEVLVYRVDASGAGIVAIDRKSLHERPIAPAIPDFARDFSIDPEEHTLTFVNLARPADATADAEWKVVRIDLASGAEVELWRSSSMSLVPFALPHGEVLATVDPVRGAGTLFGPLLPLGQGAAHAAGLSSDRAFLSGTTNLPGQLGKPFVLDLDGKLARFVDVPAGARAIVAGFVELPLAEAP